MPATKRVQVIIPTAINLLTAVNETMLTLHKAGDTAAMELPSLRRRALLVVKEIGTLPIQTTYVEDDPYTR
jgi:hypothetical protein